MVSARMEWARCVVACRTTVCCRRREGSVAPVRATRMLAVDVCWVRAMIMSRMGTWGWRLELLVGKGRRWWRASLLPGRRRLSSMWLASCMARSNRAHWSQCCVGAPVMPGVRRSFLAREHRGCGHGKRWCALGLGRRRGGGVVVLGGALLRVPSARRVVWTRRFLGVGLVVLSLCRRFFSFLAAIRAEMTRWILMA